MSTVFFIYIRIPKKHYDVHEQPSTKSLIFLFFFLIVYGWTFFKWQTVSSRCPLQIRNTYYSRNLCKHNVIIKRALTFGIMILYTERTKRNRNIASNKFLWFSRRYFYKIYRQHRRRMRPLIFPVELFDSKTWFTPKFNKTIRLII